MRRLYILRHAKSSWDDPGLPDRERPLAERGRRAARAMGEHMERAGIRPSLALCSTAARARQTLDALLPFLPKEIRIENEDGLYGADAEELLERVRLIPADDSSVLLIGHNPAVQDLTLMLAQRGEGLERAATKFPTGALAILEFDSARWSDLRPAAAALTSFVAPGDLS